MATDIPEKYRTESGRLISFQNAQPVSKRRASNASSRAPKSLKWPHAFLDPEKLAAAGFFFYPTQESPDNVVCFHCARSMCGWEGEDDPFVEHLKLSPHCAWAIVASVEARGEEICKENPLSARMIEARKATFGDKWPHEGKKGWKCKVKQLVDAGWIYKPTEEYDDFAACVYCGLGLDGWEPNDKPMHEHFNRVPNCPFFTLINEPQQSPVAKRTKAHKSRTSKASRLSTQSTFTTVSDAPSFASLAAEDEDSVLTTATNTTVTSQSGRKMAKGKKTYGKGRKTKTKKDEPVEVPIAAEPEDDDFEVKVELKATATRGKKRKSEVSNEALSLPGIQEPPAKRRTSRSRGSIAIPETISVAIDVEEGVEEKPKSGQKKGRASAKASRKASTATLSKTSFGMDIADDEVGKMLKDDLEKPLTNDEIASHDLAAAIGLKSPASAGPRRKATRASKVMKADHSMFGVDNMMVDDEAIEAELAAMETEESKVLPKVKAAKGGQARKVSAKQQAAAKRAQAEAEMQRLEPAEEPVILQAEPQRRVGKRTTSQQPSQSQSLSILPANTEAVNADLDTDMKDQQDSGNETDASVASQSTVVKGGPKRRGSALKKGRGGKRVVSRNIEDIVSKTQEVAETKQEKPSKPSDDTVESGTVGELRPVESMDDTLKTSNMKPVSKGKGKLLQERSALQSTESAVHHHLTSSRQQFEQARASTPKSSQRSAKELTPSPSPQSSDAENHPPSSKPSAIRQTPSHQVSRVPLAPSTPTMSPSKRNIVAGLQSSLLWTTVDLEEILLKSPTIKGYGAQADVFADTVGKATNGKLTSPEKKMTVEEWILFNANMAEEKLRAECERMVAGPPFIPSSLPPSPQSPHPTPNPPPTSATHHALPHPLPQNPPKTHLILGATRGIGLALTTHLLSLNHLVLATARPPDHSLLTRGASALWSLTGSPNGHNLRILELDVADESSVERLVAAVGGMGFGKAGVRVVDVCWAVAGVLEYPCRIVDMTFTTFTHHLTTNTIGPLLCTTALLKSGIPIATLAFLSSDSGSMARFRAFEDGFAGYAASKAALNMGLRHLAAELSRLAIPTTVLALHPGEVATDMANVELAWEVEGIIGAEESVRGMMTVIEERGRGGEGEERKGEAGFFTWQGERYPW